MGEFLYFCWLRSLFDSSHRLLGLFRYSLTIRLKMRKLLRIGKPSTAFLNIPQLLSPPKIVALQLRGYSTNPPKPRIDIKQTRSVNDVKKKVVGAQRTWSTKRENEILDRLLQLVKSRQFNELLEALKVEPSLTLYIFNNVIQAKVGMSTRREIQLKEKVMEIMRERGVELNASSLTPVISLYGKSGELNKADALLEMMRETGIKRSVSNYNSLMKCHIKDEAKVAELFRKMIGDGIKPNVYIYSLMIDVFAKSGKLMEAIEVFDSMMKDEIKPNVVAYTTMIDAYAKDDQIEKAIEVFDSMKKDGIEPDVVTYTTMIDAYAKSWSIDKAIEIFDSMKMDGTRPNEVTYNTMIDVYAKDGQIEKAIEVFDSMMKDEIKPNVVTYTTIIDAYAKDGQIEKAIEVFDSMKKDGIEPNVVTYTTMIDAYAKDGQIKKAIEVFDSMKKDGIQPDEVTNSTMIDAYAKSGSIDKAIEVFDSMKKDGIEPDVVAYTTMIDAYAKDGQIDKAIEVFDLMKKDGIEPNVVTYNTVINAYAKSGSINKAIEMFDSMKEDGMRPDEVTFGTILNCFAKTGKHLKEMMKMVKEMRDSSIEFNIHVWSSIMEGFSRAEDEKDQKKALSIWKYLSGQISYESLGVEDLPVKTPSLSPDCVTLSLAIDACKLGRFEKEADEVWMYGQESGEIFPDSNVLTSYVECLAAFGEKGADRVVELILRGAKGERMPLRCVRPDEKTIKNARSCLVNNGCKKQAAMLDGIEI
jgi:pentatricopeptide repeat protein